MLILMRKDARHADAGSPEELARMLFRTAVEAYNDQAADREAYLHESDEDDYAEELSLVDGAADPDAIREMALGWNKNIAKVFDGSLSAVMSGVKGDGSEKWLSVPSPLVYGLKKAVMALDNDFYSFAEEALLVNDRGYFTTRLQDAELADILAHPENYAAIDAAPK